MRNQIYKTYNRNETNKFCFIFFFSIDKAIHKY